MLVRIEHWNNERGDRFRDRIFAMFIHRFQA